MNLDKVSGLDLTPGTVIPQWKIEEILGFRRKDDTDKFDLKTLDLRDVLEPLASALMGDRECRIVGHKHGLRVLRTEEISAYFDKQQKQAYQRAKKSLKYLNNQNTSVLTKDEKEALKSTRLRAASIVKGYEDSFKKYPMPESKDLPQVEQASFKQRQKFV